MKSSRNFSTSFKIFLKEFFLEVFFCGSDRKLFWRVKALLRKLSKHSQRQFWGVRSQKQFLRSKTGPSVGRKPQDKLSAQNMLATWLLWQGSMNSRAVVVWFFFKKLLVKFESFKAIKLVVVVSTLYIRKIGYKYRPHQEFSLKRECKLSLHQG